MGSLLLLVYPRQTICQTEAGGLLCAGENLAAKNKKEGLIPFFRCAYFSQDSAANRCHRSPSSPLRAAARVHFIRGKVEETIPSQAPESIALLRMDTDWYESTRHELEHLFPRLSPGGILIIDDYGDWQGARRATDEFLANHAPALFLSRIDDTGRLAVKI
ncbi:MAG: TylF/MycF/NovP-related O-methyltransferase [Bryobacteraceae bacterium]